MNNEFKHKFVFFVIMFSAALFLNPIHILANKISNIYISLTLVYISLYMASNMIWLHEIIKYINIGIFNPLVFIFGILLSLSFTILLRKQVFVSDKEWLKRMITHHSTALNTSHKILKKTKNKNIKKLAESIINSQEKEIKLMKNYLN